MKNLRKYSLLLILVIVAFLVFTNCNKKDDVNPERPTLEELARNEFYGLMNDWYLWYDKMPVVNVEDYDTPEELLEALRYDSLDKWSYISPLDEFTSYYEEGEYEGHGFGYTYDEDGKAWITFVFRDSDFNLEGVKRSWQMLAINGTDLQSFTDISAYLNGNTVGTIDQFTFKKPDGTSVDISSTRKVIKMNTVIHADTLHVSGKIVGHMVFKSFIAPSIAELDSVFQVFKSAGVQELILDLRYNGGGRMDVTAKLASLISGPSTDGKLLIKYIHNNKQGAYNSAVNLGNETNALNLQQLIVIASRGTASASEVIINGLRPHINVKIIGENTYGKPVGMHTWTYAETYAFVPISFSMLNFSNEGNYYEGLLADSYIEDGLAWDFPDRNEKRLKEAIHYIETGSFTGGSAPLKSHFIYPYQKKKGLRREIGAE
ncbi:MAG: S41 family peptidase [Bacteroidales bacterium]|nr:S41 family peptidase [Bacteroidales bacterium]